MDYITYRTEHYIFHYRPDSPAERDIKLIADCQEECFKRITDTLKIYPSFLFHYWLCDSPEEVGRIYGDNDPCNGFAAEPDRVYAVYNDEIQCIGAHEDAHLVSYLINIPSSCFLREGLAMYFDGSWWGRDNRDWARELYLDKKASSVSAYMQDDFFYSVDCSISYPIAGAFTAYLLETYGLKRYLTFYSYQDDDWEVHYRDIFGLSLAEIEEAFLQSLMA